MSEILDTVIVTVNADCFTFMEYFHSPIDDLSHCVHVLSAWISLNIVAVWPSRHMVKHILTFDYIGQS